MFFIKILRDDDDQKVEEYFSQLNQAYSRLYKIHRFIGLNQAYSRLYKIHRFIG